MKKVCCFFTPILDLQTFTFGCLLHEFTVIIHSFLRFNNEQLLFKSGGPVTKWLQASFQTYSSTELQYINIVLMC